MKNYNKEYEASIKDSQKFWAQKAREILTWEKDFNVTYKGKLGSDQWFPDGELNACYNCIDRWAISNPDRVALIFNSNDNKTTKFTYRESLLRIYEICHHLKHIKKDQCVTLYLPMGPEAVFSALACARLGLTHNAVFGGFSSDSLKLRIQDSKSTILITQDISMRGEKKINFMETVSNAVEGLDIEVILFDKENPGNKSINGNEVKIKNLKLWSQLKHCTEPIDCVVVPSEHSLFYLYTSGSTGMPKGLIHSTAGYLLYAAYTLKTAFDIRENDVFCCTADIGWITGHSYSIYGPLCLGITSVIIEGLPTYPSYTRFYDVVDKYKITQFYTAPTAIRILKKYFESTPLDTSVYDFSSLRSLGSVGEPINKEAYKFYSESFGGLHVVDTYWQTETGGFLIAPILGVKKGKPECATLPMPGIVPIVSSEEEDSAANFKMNAPHELGKIYIAQSWPGIARGILNNRERYLSAYFSTPFYFTGDEGIIDEDGDFWIKGRADDVINVSGHRISTAEVESTACTNNNVAEAAVVSISHPIKGQSMVLFVVLKNDDPDFELKVKSTISNHIGGFCRPDRVIKTSGIPKTATGKIMRRILRSLLLKTETGDLSTCINTEIIEELRNSFHIEIGEKAE